MSVTKFIFFTDMLPRSQKVIIKFYTFPVG